MSAYSEIRRAGKDLLKRGFTMIELLVVISVMAVVATLATGAAVKSIRQGRAKRISVTIVAITSALENYRTQQGCWPFDIRTMRKRAQDGKLLIVTDPTTQRRAQARLRELERDENDFYVFKTNPDVPADVIQDKSLLEDMYMELYQNGHLNGSGVDCEMNGYRKPLSSVSRSNPGGKFVLCCPGITDSSEAVYFGLSYNAMTDQAKCVYWDNSSTDPHWTE